MIPASDRAIEHYDFTWRGIDIRIVYERDFLGISDQLHGTAYLQVQNDAHGQPLPMTETGYQSHLLPPSEVEASGGVIAYVTRWLDAAALKPAWKAIERERRQRWLF